MRYARHTEHLFHVRSMAWTNYDNSAVFFVGCFKRTYCNFTRVSITCVRQNHSDYIAYRLDLCFLVVPGYFFAKGFRIGRIPSALADYRTVNHFGWTRRLCCFSRFSNVTIDSAAR